MLTPNSPNISANTTDSVIRDIIDILHVNALRVTSDNVVIAGYIVLKAREAGNESLSFTQIIDRNLSVDEGVICIFQKEFTEEAWNEIARQLGKYDSDAIRQVILSPSLALIGASFKSEDIATPTSINLLADSLLSIGKGSLVADIGCGSGGFIMDSVGANHGAEYYGYEINSNSKTIAMIRAELLGLDIHIVQCDAFSLLEDGSSRFLPERRFNAIFSNYPFGMRTRYLLDVPGVQKLTAMYPALAKAASADWLFHALIIELLSPDGRAVCVTTNGSTWNTSDIDIRKHFVEAGLIEAVIALPERLFTATNISTSMLILSRGNSSIRMVDATSFCVRGRRTNTIETDQREAILDALLHDTEHSKTVTLEELRASEYTLNPCRYMGDTIEFADGVPFETIIRSISRGAPYTAAQLDSLVSHTPTEYQYLMLANIQAGIIDNSLPYLTGIDKKYEKYCIHTGNLILSKNGFPYKVAVASVEGGKRILANGNLYIIELDTERADPYYIKAFLESEHGIAQLQSITVGAVLPNIGVDKLKKITIPLLPMDRQKEIAAAYLAAQDEVRILRRKLEKAQSRLTHIFDTESEG